MWQKHNQPSTLLFTPVGCHAARTPFLGIFSFFLLRHVSLWPAFFFGFLNISSFFLFVLVLLLIFAGAIFFASLGSKTRSFAVFERVLCWKGRFHCIFTGDSPFFACCFYAFADSRRDDSLRCFPQSIHVATMLMSTKTPPVFAEHPCGKHDNVHKDSVRFCRASLWQPC